MPLSRTYYSGDWKATCDVCGITYPASDLRKRWDNLMVCDYDFELRQPQDFVRASVDKMSVPWSRPEPSDVFEAMCTPQGSSSITGYATAGCAVAGAPYPAWAIPSYGGPFASCTPEGMSGVADYATADCAVVGVPWPT